MPIPMIRGGLALLALTVLGGGVHAQQVRSGANAYGDWRSDAPGVTRKITPGDLPAIGASAVQATPPRVAPRPADAQLKTLPGFSVQAWVSGLDGARVIRVAPNGDIFVAQSEPGKIVVIRAGKNMASPQVSTFANGLDRPYGIAFYPQGRQPQWVYVGESGKVLRFAYHDGDTQASGQPQTIVSDLPTGGGHWTRDIAFSPDGKTLYVAVGSATNVGVGDGKQSDLKAYEASHAVGAAWGNDEWRANVLAYAPEGGHKHIYASGIRNCAGLAVQPGSGQLFCATNERDLLGDNLPPDYVTAVKPGGFYGWPWFYIGEHPDTRADGGPRPDLLGKISVPDVLLQPHSAPLGLAFVSGKQFPAAWKGDAFVALHGSWNRGQRTGYKIVRVPFAHGKPTGAYEDFVTGFVIDDTQVWGRPVDVAFAPDGSLLFSDDAHGVIYRVTHAMK